MGNMNPIDNRLAELLKDYDNRLNAIERSRQPYLGDWIQLNEATYIGDNNIRNKINVVDTDPRDFLNIGDKIRLKVSPSIYYDYRIVVYLTEDSIFVDSHFPLNSTITEIFYSKLPGPNGFSGTILGEYPINYTTAGVTDGNSEFNFFMVGNRVFANLNLDVSLSSVGNEIAFDVPIAKEALLNGLQMDSFGGWKIRITGIDSFIEGNDSDSDDKIDEFIIQKDSLVAWGTGSILQRINWEFALY